MSVTLPINLDNCAREPIHIPGLIQSHGALLALSVDRRVVHASANLRALLGASAPALGDAFTAAHFEGDEAVHDALNELLDGTDPTDGVPASSEVHLNGQVFDLVVHHAGGLAVAEFELRPAGADVKADFALKAHRAMERLKRQKSIASLMDFAVGAVRRTPAPCTHDQTHRRRGQDEDEDQREGGRRVHGVRQHRVRVPVPEPL